MISINVCVGSSCHLKGSYDVIQCLQKIIEEKGLEDKVEIKASFCLGHCTSNVSISVDDGPVLSVSKDNVDEFFEEYISGRIK